MFGVQIHNSSNTHTTQSLCKLNVLVITLSQCLSSFPVVTLVFQYFFVIAIRRDYRQTSKSLSEFP